MLDAAIEIATVAGPTLIGYFGFRFVDKKITQRDAAVQDALFAPKMIDGRTQDEWYELIKGMGREDYERLSLAPLEGLERSTNFGWNAKELMGPIFYGRLRREWYPELYCNYCDKEGCKQDCWEYQEHLEDERERERRILAKKRQAELDEQRRQMTIERKRREAAEEARLAAERSAKIQEALASVGKKVARIEQTREIEGVKRMVVGEREYKFTAEVPVPVKRMYEEQYNKTFSKYTYDHNTGSYHFHSEDYDY